MCTWTSRSPIKSAPYKFPLRMLMHHANLQPWDERRKRRRKSRRFAEPLR